MAGIRSGTLLFVPQEADVYELGCVTQRNGSVLQVELLETKSNFALDLDDLDIPILQANLKTEEDLTKLENAHLPGILLNLRERSLNDKPYTFMGGSVLVVVNPILASPEKDVLVGQPSAVDVPHPYAIAERAYQQMLFAACNPRAKISTGAQCIIVSGESGAGKTESAKMVLRHLVQRDAKSRESRSVKKLEKQLLDANPILEAFGNAATKRNYNSSRFGKFTNLFFDKSRGGGKRDARMALCGATVKTYLLERSRVISHACGERSFHVFYQLLSGLSSSQRKRWGISSAAPETFRYLVPAAAASCTSGATSPSLKCRRVKNDRQPSVKRAASVKRASVQALALGDKVHFQQLCSALDSIGVPRDGSSDGVDQDGLFSLLGAILHLGNTEFENDSANSQGDVAKLKESDDAWALAKAAELLGLDFGSFSKLLLERRVKAAGEEIVIQRSATSAREAADAVAKAIYARVFDWLVDQISNQLGQSADTQSEYSIGILDIFGFEAFLENGFEQLLINYTNEALQTSFNKQLFESDVAMLEQDGLFVDSNTTKLKDQVSNLACMELLAGSSYSSSVMAKGVGRFASITGLGSPKRHGILGVIDSEGKTAQGSDIKMNSAIHRAFKGQPCFLEPHPKDLRTTFSVQHFAGTVKYTVGQFLFKNSDKAPAEVNQLFQRASTSPLLRRVFSVGSGDENHGDTVIARFRKQIEGLESTLEATRCSFIRCVKPNPHMLRESGSSADWFDDSYVLKQLQNLGVEQAAMVLKEGYPTRVPLSVFLDYQSVFPSDALWVWKTLGRGSRVGFVHGLLTSFGVDRNAYKLGGQNAYFRAGALPQVTRVIDDAASGRATTDKELATRFMRFFARQRWRHAFAKALAVNRFEKMLAETRERNGAVTVLQRVARRRLAELSAKAELARLREGKRRALQAEAEKRAKEAKKRQKEARKKMASAAASKSRQREIEKLRLREAAATQQLADLEQKAQIAREEMAKVRGYRHQVEKEHKVMQKKEKAETRRTVSRLGGAEPYLLQKQLERELRFASDVKITTFEPWLSGKNIEAMSDPASAYFMDMDFDSELDQRMKSHKTLSRAVRVVSMSYSRAKPGLQRALSQGRIGAPALQGIGDESPPPPPLPPSPPLWFPSGAGSKGTRKSSRKSSPKTRRASKKRLSKSELQTTGWIAVKRLSRPPKSRAKKHGGRLFGLRKAFAASPRKPSGPPQSQADPDGLKDDEWVRCTLQLKGLRLLYFAHNKRSRRRDKLGEVTLANIKSVESVDHDAKSLDSLLRLDEGKRVDPDLIVHMPGSSILAPHCEWFLRFEDKATHKEWQSALDKHLSRWREQLQSNREVLRDMFDAGLIDKKELRKRMVAQGIASPGEAAKYDPVAQRRSRVSLYDLESRDTVLRVLCDECRQVNFVDEKQAGLGFWCKDCHTELELVTPTSALISDESMVDSFPTFPVSVPVESATFVIHEGKIMGSPRFDATLQKRNIYFTFNCEVSGEKPSNHRVWTVDAPYASFLALHTYLNSELAGRGMGDLLPDFPTDPVADQEAEEQAKGKKANVAKLKENARMRLDGLNDYVASLFGAAKTDSRVMGLSAVRQFFNFGSFIAVSTPILRIGEIDDLEKDFAILSQYAKTKKKVKKDTLATYNKLQAIYPRIEASADEDIFRSPDPEIHRLTLQEKGRIFSTAQDFLLVLEAFETEYLKDIRAYNQKADAK